MHLYLTNRIYKTIIFFVLKTRETPVMNFGPGHAIMIRFPEPMQFYWPDLLIPERKKAAKPPAAEAMRNE